MSSGAKPRVSICFPCFNEAKNIEKTIREWHQAFKKRGEKFEILVIDNRSDDNSCRLVESLAAKHREVRLRRNPENIGYSGSCRVACLSAKGGLVVFVDADGQYHPGDGLLALKALRKGADLVLGARIHRADPPFRKISARVFQILFNAWTGLGLKDPNVGLRAWKKNSHLARLLHPHLPFANPQIICAALDAGIGIDQIPVRHAIRLGGVSYYRLARLPFIMLRFLSFMFAWKTKRLAR